MSHNIECILREIVERTKQAVYLPGSQSLEQNIRWCQRGLERRCPWLVQRCKSAACNLQSLHQRRLRSGFGRPHSMPRSPRRKEQNLAERRVVIHSFIWVFIKRRFKREYSEVPPTPARPHSTVSSVARWVWNLTAVGLSVHDAILIMNMDKLSAWTWVSIQIYCAHLLCAS